MNERLKKLASVVAWLLLLVAGGALFIYASSFVIPIAQAVKESHGLVGFVYGLLFMAGWASTNVLVWVVTGRGIMKRLAL